VDEGRRLVTISAPVANHEYDDAALAHAGFEPAWETELRREVEEGPDALVEYLMTHSERIAAIREGFETESEQHRFLAEGIAPFYDNVLTRRVAFGVQIEGYRRLATASGTAPPAGPRVDATPSRPARRTRSSTRRSTPRHDEMLVRATEEPETPPLGRRIERVTNRLFELGDDSRPKTALPSERQPPRCR
jgi:hypothetical protein